MCFYCVKFLIQKNGCVKFLTNIKSETPCIIWLVILLWTIPFYVRIHGHSFYHIAVIIYTSELVRDKWWYDNSIFDHQSKNWWQVWLKNDPWDNFETNSGQVLNKVGTTPGQLYDTFGTTWWLLNDYLESAFGKMMIMNML